MARNKAPETDLQLKRTPFTARLERRVLDFINRRQVFLAGESALVAVSGGPDSTALLLVLARLADRLSLRLAVAHFDHLLRSRAEAAGDLAFVRRLASTLSLPLVHGHSDERRGSKRQVSPEDGARRARYEYLEAQAQALGASVVVLGHSLDDQAETVLLHLLRGSGLDGLSGMEPRASWPFGAGPAVARPLLSLRRQDILRYCADRGVEPRCDPTNALPVATRNRIRHDLMPALRAFNARVDEALARLADAAAHDAEYIDHVASEIWDRIAAETPGGVSLPRVELEALPPALAARLVRRAFGSDVDLETIHIEGILHALQKAQHRLSLPHGLTAVLDAGFLTISKVDAVGPRAIARTAVLVPGSTRIAGWSIVADVVTPPPDLSGIDRLEGYFDADALGKDIFVRSRRPGDRIKPLGLGGWKKVQDILVDAKVRAADRDSVPILCMHDGIAWVVGHRQDERYSLGPSSTSAIRIRFTKESEDEDA